MLRHDKIFPLVESFEGLLGQGWEINHTPWKESLDFEKKVLNLDLKESARRNRIIALGRIKWGLSDEEIRNMATNFSLNPLILEACEIGRIGYHLKRTEIELCPATRRFDDNPLITAISSAFEAESTEPVVTKFKEMVSAASGNVDCLLEACRYVQEIIKHPSTPKPGESSEAKGKPSSDRSDSGGKPSKRPAGTCTGAKDASSMAEDHDILERVKDELEETSNFEEFLKNNSKFSNSHEKEAFEKGMAELNSSRYGNHFEGQYKGSKVHHGGFSYGNMSICKETMDRRLNGQKAKKWASAEEGTHPRYLNRYFVDGKIFGVKRKAQGGTVLIDTSSSMGLSIDEIIKITESAPGCTVAAYSGESSSGRLSILAENGTYSSKLSYKQGGNIVDYPALIWLSKMPGPRIWVSDGIVTGVGDSAFPLLTMMCFDVVKRNSIIRVPYVKEAFNLFKRIKSA